MSGRRILVTAALPYANGPIHLGHLVEYIQTDIWVRFQRMRGHETYYVGADDTHGTAIMIRARQEGISEEELIATMRRAHVTDFAGFDIEFADIRLDPWRSKVVRDLILEGARRSWQIDRIWKGHLADLMNAIPL